MTTIRHTKTVIIDGIPLKLKLLWVVGNGGGNGASIGYEDTSYKRYTRKYPIRNDEEWDSFNEKMENAFPEIEDSLHIPCNGMSEKEQITMIESFWNSIKNKRLISTFNS